MFDRRKIRGLLPALVVALQFAVLPCVMAMPMESAGDCEHCGGAERPSHCMIAADEVAADAGLNSRDRLRAVPPSADVFSLQPLPVVPQLLHTLEPAAIAIARRTGRHSGDPPLNLLYGTFQI
ncbi:MAG: hypothetical protein WAU48_12145 [Gammaproteobacteria bacterium]